MKNLKHLPIEFDAKGVKEDGAFEGYASTFGNIDHGYDVVLPGAFTKSLTVRPAPQVKMLWQHDPAQPIGVWTHAAEDSKGLFVKGKLLKDVAKGAEAYTLMKAGVIDSMSIGYRTMEADFAQSGVRQLKEVGLFEVSLVTFPMNDQATVTTVKDFNPRDLEKALRDEGFSWSASAKAVAIFRKRLRDGGVNVDFDPREEETATQAAGIAASLRRLTEALR